MNSISEITEITDLANQSRTYPLASSGRSAEELSALIHQIYEAVAHPENWPDVVATIAGSLNAHCGCLFTPYTRPSEGGFVYPAGMDESHVLLWGTKYLDHDLWSKSAAEKNLWDEGSVLLDEQLVPRNVLAQSVFFREFLVTMNIGRVCAAMLLSSAPGIHATCLSVYRPFDAPAFTPAEVAWYQLLIPHLSRALGLQHRLNTLRVQNQILLSSFDNMDFGACVIDENGQVVYANASASKVFARRDGVLLDHKNNMAGFESVQRTSQPLENLQDWISAQIALTFVDAKPTHHFSSTFIQARSQPGKRYALQSSLLPTDFDGTRHEAPRMIVFITDPDAVQLPTAERLMAVYDLTISQARVAQALGNGSSHKEIARELNVTTHTVASHVKEVYARMKVNRQADLMRHIMALGKASV